MSEEKDDDDLDDLLDQQWELQDQIHKKCKMKENSNYRPEY